MLVTVDLDRSIRLAVLLGGLHLAAAASVLGSDLAPWAGAALGVAVLARLPATLAEHAWRSAGHAIVALSLGRGGRCRLRTRAGSIESGRILAGSVVTRALLILVVEGDAGQRRTVLVTPDMLAGPALRRLRVALRVGW